MRHYLSTAIFHTRKYSLLLVPFSLCFVAGCIVAASEPSTSKPNAVQLTWETIATIYGPMGVWLIWFIRREDIRDKRDREEKAERRKNDEEHRKEWVELVKNNTEAVTNSTTTLALVRADAEKGRSATYKMADDLKEVHIKIDGLYSAQRGGTRIIAKE